jgi:serine/threonine protein kinase
MENQPTQKNIPQEGIEPDVAPSTPAPMCKDSYHPYLEANGSSYTVQPPYLMVRQIPNDAWLIHISVVRQQFDQMLPGVIAFLEHSGLPYRIPAGTDEHNRILDGRCGPSLVGKVITAGVTDSCRVKQIAETLVLLTNHFNGPGCNTAIPLGGCIYVSFGNFSDEDTPASNQHHSQTYGFDPTAVLLDRLKDTQQTWPFNTPIPKKRKRPLIALRYLPLQCLKPDAKGNVLKCIRLNHLYNMQFCVLKEGKPFHCFDDAGRDIADRLQWQYRVHRELHNQLPLPAIYNYFQYRNTSYLAMEYIDGTSLDSQIASLYSGRAWTGLDKTTRLNITAYALQVLDIVAVLHQKGYVHRDLNPDNFILSHNGRLYLIDFELSYYCNLRQPSPAFALGSYGYMSPQQQALETPDYTDDIYSLGGLLIKLFTGTSPSKFDGTDPVMRYSQLCHFIPDQVLCRVLAMCMLREPQKRPVLQDICAVILDFRQDIEQEAHIPAASDIRIRSTDLLILAREAVRALTGPVFCNDRGLWNITGDKLIEALPGILYTLAASRYLGLLTPEETSILRQNSQQPACHISDEPGQHHFTGMNALFSTLPQRPDWLEMAPAECSETPLNKLPGINTFTRLGLCDGLAGYGLSLLNLPPEAKTAYTDTSLQETASLLCSRQQPDGSWLLTSGIGPTAGIKLPGLFHGIAGICVFLIIYGRKFNNIPAINAAEHALEYLIGQRHMHGNHRIWTLNPHLKEINPWLEDGFSGIAYLFILAFEVLGAEPYQTVAEEALSAHPENISSQFTGFANGLSGLGEVYLEAFRVFKDDRWLNRAQKIAGFLMHTGFRGPGNSRYWHADDYGEPDPAFFSGHAGIVHFLLRVSHPAQLSFPLFHSNHL